jgi:hypothetical protein
MMMKLTINGYSWSYIVDQNMVICCTVLSDPTGMNWSYKTIPIRRNF